MCTHAHSNPNRTDLCNSASNLSLVSLHISPLGNEERREEKTEEKKRDDSLGTIEDREPRGIAIISNGGLHIHQE